MVTNTGTTADTNNVKENGDCKKEKQTDDTVKDELANLKQGADEASLKQQQQPEKAAAVQQNDNAAASMSNTPNEANERSDAAATSNGIPPNPAYSNSRSFGNGMPPNAVPPVNGPPQPVQGGPYTNYGPYGYNSPYMQNPGQRGPPSSGANYPPMSRYPNAGGTPTLNQLLTTPSRYQGQAPYNNPTSQNDYNPNQPHQHWQPRPQQYGAQPPVHPEKQGEPRGYPPQHYPNPQAGYPPNAGHTRYPPQSSTNQLYNQYDSYMPPPGGHMNYPQSNNPPRHPGFPQQPGYHGYNMQQQPNYYNQPTPPPQPGYSPYGPAGKGAPTGAEQKSYGGQEQISNHNPPPTPGSDLGHPQTAEQQIMSPNRRTPQPNPASGQSPLTASQSPHVHHPAVAQLRGPSPAPSSPGSTGQPRVNPMSPPSVRPGTPHQQGAIRPSMDAAESANQSPMQGPGYSHYRAYPSQMPQQQSGPYPQHQPGYPPQHMMSPQPAHQNMYPSNQQQAPPSVPSQQYPSTPQQQSNLPLRPSGPPSGGKPAAQQMQSQGAGVNFSQNQQSPAYQQPTYSTGTPSPAPSERRTSQQSNPPSGSQPADQRTGAAAAAAAAMAAAAHSAQPGMSPSQKPGTPSYYPQPPHIRPGYPSQGRDMHYKGMPYPRMPQPGTPHRMMSAPNMASPPSQGHMPPPSAGYPPYGYPPQNAPPQGYPGTPYQQPPNDPNHHPHIQPQGYLPVPSSGYGSYDAPPPAQAEEILKSKPARSASQKLNALFEPVDEPGRREFIESIFKYWESKDLPLKNAPLMGRKTLDLFRLYQLVKERGFWQRVTENKGWVEISKIMGLGSTNTSGFTLKKQYCKYLYGYECKVERGEVEPQEAMARISEANRKKKQLAEQQAAKEEPPKSATPSTPAPPSGQTSNPPSVSASPGQQQQQYPQQSYPQEDYHHQSMRNMPYPQVNSMPKHPPGAPESRQGPYPPHPMQGDPSRPRHSGAYPPVHPTNTYPSNSTMPQASLPAENPARIGTPQNSAPLPRPEAPVADAAKESGSTSAAPSIRPPVPADTTLAAGNPFNEPGKQGHSYSASGSYPPPGTFHQGGYPHRMPMGHHDPYRGTYPTRPGMPQMQTNYPNSSTPLNRLMPPNVGHPMGMGPTPPPQNSPAYPAPLPGHPIPPRPAFSAQSPYPSHHANYNYSGLKRPAQDSYHGPPSKYNRPEPRPPHYPPSSPYASYQMAQDQQNRYPHTSIPSTQVTYTGIDEHGGSPHPQNMFPYPKRNSVGAYKLDHRSRGLAPTPARVSSPIPYSNKIRMTRRHVPGFSTKSFFPPGCVESTMPRLTKFHHKTSRDVGVIEAWRVIMALKSGLLAESTWALNALTILLYDDEAVRQLKLPQLPCLLDCLVEHYRRCLVEIFDLAEEQEALGLTAQKKNAVKMEKIEEVDEVSDYTFTSKPKHRGRKRKNCVIASKQSSKFNNLPIKVEPRSDPFVLDKTDQWDLTPKVELYDDLSHIVLSFAHPKITHSSVVDDDVASSKNDSGEPMMVVEATLEDILSIPCSVLFPEEYDIHRSSIADEPPKSKDPAPNSRKKGIGGDLVCADKTSNSVRLVNGNDLKPSDKSPGTNPCDGRSKGDSDVTDKLNDVTNMAEDGKGTEDGKTKNAVFTTDELKNKCKLKNEKVESLTETVHPLCNGVQSDAGSVEEDQGKEKEDATEDPKEGSEKEVKIEPVEEDSEKKEKSKELILSAPSRVTFRVESVLKERNVILLEDEVLGSEGSMSDMLSGSIVASKACDRLEELSKRAQCILNIIRGLSFIPMNCRDLCQNRSLMRVLSGSLLLRHKHRSRPRYIPGQNNEVFRSETAATDAEISRRQAAEFSSKSYDLFAPRDPKKNQSKTRNRFSVTVFDEDDRSTEEIFKNPWWWDCVRRIREDSLVILSNISPALDLSNLPDDHTALAVIEACLHWTVCPSSDACDAFSAKSRNLVSPQRLALEILTKLTIKEQNIDLILATRPFSRIEKLFNYLVGLLCDRKDQAMREFALVLLCNLSSGDVTAARAIDLQKGALPGLVSFLEECEEAGMSSRRMLPGASINCGTTHFMMVKCASTLLALAQVEENKPGFVKYQLRLLTLSMSQFIPPKVTSTISSVLFEISRQGDVPT